MNLFRILGVSFLLTFQTIEACAQCNMTSNGGSWWFTCGTNGTSGYLNESASWSGGTPPFTVQWLGSQPQTVFTNSATTSFFWPSAPQVMIVTGPVVVTDAMQCQVSITYPQHAALMTLTALQASVAATDCAGGVFAATFVDAPGAIYQVLSADLSCISYTLRKNGSVLQTGTLNMVQFTNPARLFFPGLTNGSYSLEMLQTGVCNPNTAYCPSFTVMSFSVPGPGDCIALNLRTALQGALPSGSTVMNDGLRTAGLLPLTEPYSALGYTYTGSSPGVIVPASFYTTTGNDAIVDWVVVELRSPAAPYAVLHSKPALLQRDGDITDTDGDGHVSFPQPNGSYRIALRHRNHLGLMTGFSVQANANPVLVDFKNSALSTYGTNARAWTGAVLCQWSGDVTGNGTIAYTGAGNDRDPILIAIGGNVPTATLTGQYRQEDVNLDGVVKYVGANNDRDPILSNIGGTTPTNTRTQQLP
ncbi:MAG: hypothetical protein IPO17_02400 [Flavobacteriales bacterium]|nr:hypothetical protein [Flavobacteriales bacterium]